MSIKIYTLSTCSTSKRILKELLLDNNNSDIQDIKSNKITKEQLNEMKALSGSYESLFSKRSQKYKTVKPIDRDLTEQEMHNLILEEYTFLKRPVVIIDKNIFIGNSKKNVELLGIYLKSYWTTK